LAALVRNYSVLLVVAKRGHQLEQGLKLDDAKAVCDEVVVALLEDHLAKKASSIPGLTLLRQSVFSRPDHAISLTKSAREELSQIVGQSPWDFVLCMRISGATIWEECQRDLGFSARRIFIDFDDVVSEVLRHSAAVERTRLGFERAIMERIDALRIRSWENHLLRTYEMVSICSNRDRDRLKARVPSANIAVIPNSVELPATTSMPVDASDRTKLLFVGTMGYGPNVDAAGYFCTAILPLIRRRWDREIVLSIVGYRPTEEVQALARIDGVTVTGSVPSVDSYYRDSQIVLCPIRYGSGTRIKILEAMSHMRPVVSTTIGCEGIDVTPGENILIGDTPDDFADACLRLIQDVEFRCKLAAAGNALVARRYSTSVVTDLAANLFQGDPQEGRHDANE